MPIVSSVVSRFGCKFDIDGGDTCGSAGKSHPIRYTYKYRDKYARTLSGGEIQRVALARALATAPELLLPDELRANPDPHTAKTTEALIERRRNSGLTVVLSVHDLGQSIRLCDRVAVIIEERLAHLGSAEEVFGTPISPDVEAFLQGWRGAVSPSRRGGTAGELDGKCITFPEDRVP